MLKVLLVAIPMSPEAINWPPALLSVGDLTSYARQDPWIQAHVEIEILSYMVGIPGKDDRDDEHILQVILLKKPDIVGFSCYIWNIEHVRHITQLLKIINPQITVIWGGPEVGYAPREAMLETPLVDVVVRGEGEHTFVELLKVLGNGRRGLDQVAGIACRQDSKVIVTAERPPIASLDAIPSPYLAGILTTPESKRHHIALEGYRGCPYRCGFCMSPGHPRCFSLDRVRKELEFCFESEAESFLFVDPYLNIRKDRLLAMADILEGIDPKQKKMAACFLMAALLDEETVSALRRMNVPMAKIGLQSTNPEVLTNIHLQVDLDKFRRAIGLLQAAGIAVHLQLIAGLPGDTFEGLRRTLDAAFTLAPNCISCYTPLLLPGSDLYRRRDRFRIAYDPRPPHRILSHYSLAYDQMLKCLEFAGIACREYNSLNHTQQKQVRMDEEAWGLQDEEPRVRTFFSGA